MLQQVIYYKRVEVHRDEYHAILYIPIESPDSLMWRIICENQPVNYRYSVS